MKKEIKSVCIYCGSRFGTSPAYQQAAELLAKNFAQMGIEIVFGAGSLGLMGAVAETALANGGKVTGIIPEFLNEREIAVKGLSREFYTKTMHERKELMDQLSDAFVILPGGLGTLDETFEILTWKQLGLHNKPIVVVNVDGYWDLLAHLLEHIIESGFADKQHLQSLRIVNSVHSVYPAMLEQLANHQGQS